MAFSTSVPGSPLTALVGVETDAKVALKTIKGSAGVIRIIEVVNPNATPVYLKIYDDPAAVVGTTIPTAQFPIPGTSTDFIATFLGTNGLTFAAGILISCSDTAGVAAGSDPGTAVIVRLAGT